MKIFGREPIVVTTAIAAVLQMLNMFWLGWSDNQMAVVNGAIAVVLGAVAVGLTSVDRLLPLLAGVVEAILHVGLVFGLPWSAEKIGSIIAAVSAVVAIWGVRPQVTARLDANFQPVPPKSLYGRAA